MKISAETLSVLKNFAIINSSLVVQSGSEIKTISPTSTTFATAKVPEVFPKKFCIYDLSKFLGAVSLFKDPEFDFKDNYVKISGSQSNSSLNFHYANESHLKFVTPAKMNLPAESTSFKLSAKQLNEITRASSVLGTDVLSIKNEDGQIVLKLEDGTGGNSNNYFFTAGPSRDSFDYEIKLRVANLNVLPNDYNVSIHRINDKSLAFFSSENVSYYMGGVAS